MKRVLCFLLSLCLLVALTGCMSQEEREARKEALTALSGDSNGTYSLSNGTMVEIRPCTAMGILSSSWRASPAPRIIRS